MKRFMLYLVALVVAMTAIAPTAQAQWSALTPAANDGGEFWDNPSWDGANCNIGFILGGASACGSQRPLNWLPYGGMAATFYKTTPGAYGLFTAPNAQITVGGDIAGLNQDWGWFTTDVNVAGNRHNLTSTVPEGTVFNIAPTAPWGFYIQRGDGTYVTSTSSHFAFFGIGNGTTPIPNAYVVGIEDLDLGWGDRDYNDVIFGVTADRGSMAVVPEPSTYMLMAVGMVGLFGIRRLRKTA